jgi:hypothetical protein
MMMMMIMSICGSFVDLKEKMMGQPLKKDEERSICGSEI